MGNADLGQNQTLMMKAYSRKFNKLDSENLMLKKSVHKIEVIIKELKSENKSIQNQIGSLQDSVAHNTYNINELDNKVSNIESRIINVEYEVSKKVTASD